MSVFKKLKLTKIINNREPDIVIREKRERIKTAVRRQPKQFSRRRKNRTRRLRQIRF